MLDVIFRLFNSDVPIPGRSTIKQGVSYRIIYFTFLILSYQIQIVSKPETYNSAKHCPVLLVTRTRWTVDHYRCLFTLSRLLHTFLTYFQLQAWALFFYNDKEDFNFIPCYAALVVMQL